ncbi:MAG: GNAT family N-acetyltransferase [Bacillota bacterium]
MKEKSDMDIKIKTVENKKEFDQVLRLRYRVFVEEQGVPVELERDDKDEEAVHVIAEIDNQTVGCGRIVFTEGKAKIGRLAVDKNWRQQGIGSKICLSLINIARTQGYDKVILHAQLDSVEFYKRLGFATVSDIFEEAGIDHIKMEYSL